MKKKEIKGAAQGKRKRNLVEKGTNPRSSKLKVGLSKREDREREP